MGRGRAKAKQQKVARELKYNTHHLTDLDALQRELGGSQNGSASRDDDAEERDEYDDWAAPER